MSEKRRHKRLDLDVTLELERIDDAGVTTVKYARVEVTDISRSGLGFTSQQELPVGGFYDTKIQIWTKEVVEVIIEIVRCTKLEDGTYKYGCFFVGMPDVDAVKIDIYQIFNDL